MILRSSKIYFHHENDSTKFQLLKLSIIKFGCMLLSYLRTVCKNHRNHVRRDLVIIVNIQ